MFIGFCEKCNDPTEDEPYTTCISCNKLFHVACIPTKISNALKGCWKCPKCAVSTRRLDARSLSLDDMRSRPTATKKIMKKANGSTHKLTDVDEESVSHSDATEKTKQSRTGVNQSPRNIASRIITNDINAEFTQANSQIDQPTDTQADMRTITPQNINEMLTIIANHSQNENKHGADLTSLFTTVIRGFIETNVSVQNELKLLREKIERLEICPTQLTNKRCEVTKLCRTIYSTR